MSPEANKQQIRFVQPGTNYRFRGQGTSLLVAAACLVTSACALPVETDEVVETDIETRGQALTNPDPTLPVFKSWVELPLLANQADEDHAFCPIAAHSFFAFARTKNSSDPAKGPYKAYLHGITNGRWVGYGSKEFVTRPSCIKSGTVDGEALVMGRAKDGKLYFSRAGHTSSPPPGGLVPDALPLTAWALVNNTTYSGEWGGASLANHDGEIVAAVAANSRRIDAYIGDNTGNWSGRYSATLPTGWTLEGVPAIAFLESWLHKYMIVARVNNNGIHWLCFTFFDNFYGFTGAAGGSTPSFTMLPQPSSAPYPISDPGFEYDPAIGAATIYATAWDGYVYQTSGFVWDLGQGLWQKIRPDYTYHFTNAPVASNELYEHGFHQVMVRRDNGKLYQAEAVGPEIQP